MEDYFALCMERRAVSAVGTLALAHLGDGVYELLVRARLCTQGRATPAALHRAAVEQVRASAQASAMARLLPLLDEEELTYYRRGRNAHAHHSAPRSASPEEYAMATGLETLFGALYLLGRRARLNELFEKAMEDDHAV